MRRRGPCPPPCRPPPSPDPTPAQCPGDREGHPAPHPLHARRTLTRGPPGPHPVDHPTWTRAGRSPRRGSPQHGTQPGPHHRTHSPRTGAHQSHHLLLHRRRCEHHCDPRRRHGPAPPATRGCGQCGAAPRPTCPPLCRGDGAGAGTQTRVHRRPWPRDHGTGWGPAQCWGPALGRTGSLYCGSTLGTQGTPPHQSQD